MLDATLKLFSAYILFLCLYPIIDFGSSIFEWDAGTIFGFVVQTDFMDTFGSKRHNGVQYISRIRSVITVAILYVCYCIRDIKFDKTNNRGLYLHCWYCQD